MFNTESKVELHLLKAVQATQKDEVVSKGFTVPNQNTPQPQMLNMRYYRVAPICAYCGQPCADDDLMTSVRDQHGNDLPAHKECSVKVMMQAWTLLEEEGKGEIAHFDDSGHDDLLADETQITPYLVAPLDEVTPAASLDKQWHDEPQQVHRS